MNIKLDTQLKSIPLPKTFSDFWDNILLAKKKEMYGYIQTNYIKSWRELTNDVKDVFDLLRELTYFYYLENNNFINKQQFNTPENEYISIQLLDILTENNINILEIINNSLENNDRYPNIMPLYLTYLNYKNQFIPDKTLNHFVSEIKKYKKFSHSIVDDDIDTYFSLLKAIPKEKITYTWFIKNLENFCLHHDDRELVSFASYLNYDSQKKIYDYIQNHFAEHVEENLIYYSAMKKENNFSVQRLHQGLINVNLYQIIKEFDLTQKKFLPCNP